MRIRVEKKNQPYLTLFVRCVFWPILHMTEVPAPHFVKGFLRHFLSAPYFVDVSFLRKTQHSGSGLTTHLRLSDSQTRIWFMQMIKELSWWYRTRTESSPKFGSIKGYIVSLGGFFPLNLGLGDLGTRAWQLKLVSLLMHRSKQQFEVLVFMKLPVS